MQIRMARMEDAEGIARVKVETWRDTYKDIIKKDYLDTLSIEEIKENFCKWIKCDDSSVMVLEEQGEIVGYVSGGEARCEPYKGWGEVYALYILPAYQRRGGGQGMLYYMVEALKDLGYYKLVIWCISGNPSQYFYMKMGGQPDKVETLTIGGEQYLERAFVWHDVLKILYDEELLS